MTWYRIELSYAVFAVTTKTDEFGDERIVTAAPIGRWMVGKRLDYVARWVERKSGKLRVLP